MTLRFSVCIPTYRRANSLRDLLNSLSAQDWLPSIDQFEVVIADNDQLQSARSTVASWASENPTFEVKYICIASKGLSFVRNGLLAAARYENLIFLDDDQLVTNRFFKTVCDSWAKADVKIAAGQFELKCDFAPKIPPTIMQLVRSLIEADLPESMSEVEYMATGGAIIRRSAIELNGSRFSQRLNAIGGEDSQFFYELRKVGPLVSLKGVIVFERIDLDRSTLMYWFFSSLHKGSLFTFVLRMQRRYSKLLLHLACSPVWFVLILTCLPALFVFHRALYRVYLCRLARQLGKLIGWSGYVPKVYLKGRTSLIKSHSDQTDQN